MADNASTDGTVELVAGWGGNVSLLAINENVGVAGRNRAVERARGELILMLDDDSYPLPGAVEVLAGALSRDPQLGIAGGRVIEIDSAGNQNGDGTGPGTFDWFLRSRGSDQAPDGGNPASFFAQCGCLIRREAFLEVGGCFEPFFFYGEELDLTARMAAAGWQVRYYAGAAFAHLRELRTGRTSPAIRRMLRHRIRNQIWYFWLRFPFSMAVRRIPAYLAFDLIECVYRGELNCFVDGVANAWTQRELIQGLRHPLPREAIRRAERDRGRRHVLMLAAFARRRLPRRLASR